MRVAVRPLALLALAAGLAGAAPGHAATLTVDYTISLAGLPLGTANLGGTFEGVRYKMDLQARLSGLAGILLGGRGAASAAGSLATGQLLPASFTVTSRSFKESRTVRMALAGGNVAALEITPPVDEKPDRVPLEDAHKRGVVDPVSALLMPALGKGDLTDPANCNRTIPVFDGAARFNVVLSYQETKRVETNGYAGPVLVCNARYVPIAGHRAARPSTRFMRGNRDMQVWLAPLEGTRALLPLRISVRTMIGMSVIEATRWALDGDARVIPAAGRQEPRR